MDKVRRATLILFSGLLLSGCSSWPPLISGEFSRLEVIIENELVFETGNTSHINEVIQAINTSRRDETYNWELPEPVGSITLQQAGEELTIALYDEGGVTVDQYFVYAGLDF